MNVGVSNRPVSDLILANLIVLSAVILTMFIPIANFALPFLVFIYLEVGLFGFVLTKEQGKEPKYESLFVNIKKFVKIFCLAIVKIFLVLFWTIFLIVPGVICLLDLAFCDLILFECPNLDVKGVVILSRELAKGYRLVMLFYFAIALASVCVAATTAYFVLLIFDTFLFVSPTVYLVIVIAAAILDFVLLAMPLCQIAITDCYLASKQDKSQKL